MASMDDWTILTHMTENKNSLSPTIRDKYQKKKELEAIKEAEKLGYFLNPSLEVLLSKCGGQNAQRTSLADLRLINLSAAHLRNVGDIGSCTNLTICLLAKNFLTKIDALSACKHLARLDLHSNQLISVPGQSFWKNLDKLQVLHLHDNPIENFETLQILGSAASLSILTLYDTPLSLKKNYRHHAVNSILTLKALDLYVISDEEIIEDAVFVCDKFRAQSPVFRIDLCPQTPSNLKFPEEVSVLRALIAKVDSILAKHSPVIIIQRYVRGHLLRRKIGPRMKLRPTQQQNRMTTHLPSTPVYFDKQIKPSFAGEMPDFSACGENKSHISVLPTENGDFQIHFGQIKANSTPPFQESQCVYVDIQKLHSNIISSLQNDSLIVENSFLESKGQGQIIRKLLERKKTGSAESSKARSRRVKDVKQLFMPVMPLCSTDEEEHDVPLADFRLKGRKPALLIADATTEIILSKREAGQMVREAEADRMTRKFLQPPVQIKHNTLTTVEHRLMMKKYATMGLPCLLSVFRAYREREKAEAASAKVDNILGMREEILQGRDRKNMYLSNKKARILKSKDLDRENIDAQIKIQQLQKLTFLDKQQEHKIRRLDAKKVLMADNSFMQRFSCQQNSVSNALQRYDHQVYTDSNRRDRQKLVSAAKLAEVEHHTKIKQYQEKQKLMRQTKAAMEKAALNTRILTEANERAASARNRVASRKMGQTMAQVFFSLPASQASSASAILKRGSSSGVFC